MSLACTPTDRRCAISSRTLQATVAPCPMLRSGGATRLGRNGITWDSMGVNGQEPPGCGLRTPSHPRDQIATEPGGGRKAVRRAYQDRRNPCPSVLCDTDPTPVHKGAGRKPVAIDPSEVVVQGTQRVVPLRPELWRHSRLASGRQYAFPHAGGR